MKLLITALLASTIFVPVTDISMLGIKIGDPKTVVDKLKLKVVAQDNQMTKYKTDSGNDFSVTTLNGNVVFMENDWMQQETAKQPLFSDFQFGVTSLSDIRQKFGTNGFTYKATLGLKTATDAISFNCFEFDSPNNEILVTITKISLKEQVNEQNVAAKLKLVAIIIATKDYLDKIWKTEKLFDPNYKKIKP